MTSEILEDYTIAIPAIPAKLFRVIRPGLRNYMGDGVWKVEEGGRVKEGEEIVNYYGHGRFYLSDIKISIVAPVSGKIILRGNTDVYTWSEITKSPAWDNDREWRTSMVVIQPVKGAQIQNAVSKAYAQLLDFIDGFINEPHKLKSKGKFSEEDWKEIQEDLEMLSHAKARVQSINP